MKEQTILLFRRKSWADNLEAMADRIHRSRYDRTHYKLHRKSQAGDVEAAITMGRYWLGEGPKKDADEALTYLWRPVRAGNADAQALMLLAFLDGINDIGASFFGWTEHLRVRLLRYKLGQLPINAANASGNGLRTLVCMKEIFEGDASRKMASFNQLREYAMDGSPPAAAAAGWCSWKGEGIPADYQTAYIWLSVAKTLGMRSLDGDMETVARSLPAVQLTTAQQAAVGIFDEIFVRLAQRQGGDAPADVPAELLQP